MKKKYRGDGSKKYDLCETCQVITTNYKCTKCHRPLCIRCAALVDNNGLYLCKKCS